MSDEPTAIDPQPIIEELNTLLTSKPFAKAERLKSLLSYVVHATLNNETDRIKGYTIGVEVFERPADFDPQIDTVVRVTAVRLRNKLKQYYESLAQPAKVQIVLPVRSYVPEFIFNEQQPAQAVATSQQISDSSVRNKPIIALVTMAGVLVIALVLIFNWQTGEPSLDDITQNVYKLENEVASQSLKVADNYFQKEDYTNAVLHYQKAANAAPHNSELLRRLGKSNFALTQYNAAKVAFEAALEIDKKVDEHSLKVAQDLYHLGVYCRYTKQYRRARQFYLDALKITRKHHNVALDIDIYYGLARVHTFLADNKKAKDYIGQAFDTYQTLNQQNGQSNPDEGRLFRLYSTRGLIHKRQDNYVEAIIDMVKATELATSHYGPDHSEVAKQGASLAIMYYIMGQHGEAMVQFKQALKVTKQLFGGQHFTVATLYNNMAIVATAQKQYVQALTYLERSRTVYENSTTKYRLNYALNLSNVASVYQLQGKFDAALAHFEQALVLYIRDQGEEHQDVAELYQSIGDIHQQLGDNKKAEQLYKKAVTGYLIALGKDHKYTLAAQAKLANIGGTGK
ncbi:MAG: tetratricopeptide repeat protein [Algicola sp.]|nr:tetratricopeptide repeat protein [Algicola sp.]